jgi:hypothetical protein
MLADCGHIVLGDDALSLLAEWELLTNGGIGGFPRATTRVCDAPRLLTLHCYRTAHCRLPNVEGLRAPETGLSTL